MRMRYFLSIVAVLLYACQSRSTQQINDKLVDSSVVVAIDTVLVNPTRKNKEVEWEDIEVMDYRDIKYQGSLPRYFSVADFERVFGKIDSLVPVSSDAPCDDGLFWYKHDGSLSMEELNEISQYWFKNGSRYERYADSVAVDNFKLRGGNFIVFKDIRLDSLSTIKDFGRLFPNATKGLSDMDVYQEGRLQMLILKEEPLGISDGHLRLFFKDGRFYMIHHWFPC